MDPRYTDFGEVEFSALHHTIQSKYGIRVRVTESIEVGHQFKVLVVAWLGGGNSFATYWFKLITFKHLDFGGSSS